MAGSCSSPVKTFYSCVNCTARFPNRKRMTYEIKVEVDEDEVTDNFKIMKVEDALSNVYQLNGRKRRNRQNVCEEDMGLCTDCGNILTKLMSLYIQLDNLREVDSYLAKELKERVSDLDGPRVILERLQEKDLKHLTKSVPWRILTRAAKKSNPKNVPKTHHPPDQTIQNDSKPGHSGIQIETELPLSPTTSTEMNEMPENTNFDLPSPDLYTTDHDYCPDADEEVNISLTDETEDNEEEVDVKVDVLNISKVMNKEYPFKCPRCPLSFISLTLLTHHKQICTRNKIPTRKVKTGKNQKGQFVCRYTECGKIFNWGKSRRDHELAIHSNTRKYKCTVEGCEWASATMTYLRHHLKVHDRTSKFMCCACGKAYRTVRTLRNHEVSHTQESCYECEFSGCGRKFREKGMYAKHLRIHSKEEKPYKCQVCESIFQYKRQLTEHQEEENHGSEKVIEFSD